MLPSLLPHFKIWHRHPPVEAQNPGITHPNQLHFHPTTSSTNTFNSKMYLKTFFICLYHSSHYSACHSLLTGLPAFFSALSHLLHSPTVNQALSLTSFAIIPIASQCTLKAKCLWTIRPHMVWPLTVTFLSFTRAFSDLLSVGWTQAWYYCGAFPLVGPFDRTLLSHFQRLIASHFSDIRSKFMSDRSFLTTASKVVSQSLPQLHILFPL